MTTSYDRPAGARHIANTAPRLTSGTPTSEPPTPVEVALRARIAQIEAENADLQRDKVDLQRDRADLQRDKADLLADNAKLTTENERLLATNTALWRKIAQQDRRLDALQDNRQ
jgi:septal ring factor EnvC (AmiA/AmiB activator)